MPWVERARDEWMFTDEPMTEPTDEHDWPAAAFEDGSRGYASGYSKGLLTVVCGRAYPPGRPLSLRLQMADGPVSLSARCIGSRRTSEERFDVRMRLTNLTRAARVALEARFCRDVSGE